jgi:hypothetical protein
LSAQTVYVDAIEYGENREVERLLVGLPDEVGWEWLTPAEVDAKGIDSAKLIEACEALHRRVGADLDGAHNRFETS